MLVHQHPIHREPGASMGSFVDAPQQMKYPHNPRRRGRATRSSSEDSAESVPYGHAKNDRHKNPPTGRKGKHPQARNQRRRQKKKTKKVSPNFDHGPFFDVDPEEQAKYVALDCEMVGVGDDGLKSAVAHVCVIDWNCNILLNTYVKVTEKVTDYRTFVSGVEEEDLKSDNAMDFDDCRLAVLSLLRGKVLVGHALKNDLRALHITHPWYDTRDTAKYEPYMNTRPDNGMRVPRKLKELCAERLHRQIQKEGEKHSPLEDARAALDLYKLVRPKWEKVMEYKVNKTREIERQQHCADSTPTQ